MKAAAAALMLGLAAVSAAADGPQATAFIDLRISPVMDENGRLLLRPYGSDGRFSRAGLQLQFDRGVRGLVSQRFGSPTAGADQDAIEEAFIEQPGEWRLGKIFMPFGRGMTLRDTGVGGEYRTRLLINDLPIRIAFSAQSGRRTEGVSARVGSVLGVSVAWGSHWGAQATSLNSIREPWEAPSGARGHRLAVGVDGAFRLVGAEGEAEAVLLRDGGFQDPDASIISARLTWSGGKVPISLLVTHELQDGRSWAALGSRASLGTVAWLEPSLRFGPHGFRDLWLTVRAAF
jgi:hypothetical protein